MKRDFPIMSGAGSFYFEGNETAILICHGFNGTPQSVRFLGERLAEYGLTVYAPRLHGHGTHYIEFEQCHYDDWKNTISEAYYFLKERCTNIYVLGQSMGGTLALNLASEFSHISGVMTINAALEVPGYECYKNDFSRQYIPEDKPDIKLENVYEIVYDTVPLRSIRNLLCLMESTKEKLVNLSCPALLMKSSIDHVVPPENTDYIFQSISSEKKRIVVLPNSYHVASMDYDKEYIVQEVLSFVEGTSHYASLEKIME